MNRRLLTVGSILMLLTAALWLGDAVDWIDGATADRWSGLALKGALLAFALAVAGRLLSPLAGAITTGRCTVCGRRTHRGHTYCLDHLQETVNVTRDRERGIPTTPVRTRPHPRPRG
jgi:hypothetical protein